MAPKSKKPKPEPTPSLEATSGNSPLFFYGHTSGPYALFSQHYACTFTAPCLSFPSSSDAYAANPPSSSEMLTFHTTEQYMMYHKALLFYDTEIADQIMATPKPAAKKALGRKVRGFDEEVWKGHRERIVEEGNWWKFNNGTGDYDVVGNGKGFGERLLDTGKRELVEASPRDRIWGIGFGRNNAEANRGRWGLNLLGKALMRVRERMRAQEGGEVEEEMGDGKKGAQ